MIKNVVGSPKNAYVVINFVMNIYVHFFIFVISFTISQNMILQNVID